jgi:hypothetical protein
MLNHQEMYKDSGNGIHRSCVPTDALQDSGRMGCGHSHERE